MDVAKEIGQRIRNARVAVAVERPGGAVPMSVNEAARRLAAMTNLRFESARRNWGRWEAGDHVPTKYRPDVAAVTQTTEEALFGLLRLWLPGSRGRNVETTLSAAERINVERRDFLTAMGVLLGQLGLDAIKAAPSLAATRHIGISEVHRIQGLTAMFRSADQRYGGATIRRELVAYADDVSLLLRCSHTGRVGVLLHAAVADARFLAGWTCFDSGRQREAQRQWRLAEASAVEAGDRQMLSHVMWSRYRQARHLGDDVTALKFVREARERTAGEATPTVMADLWGSEAATLSSLRDVSAAQAALQEAENAFARSNPADDPPWAAYITEGELYAHFSSAHRDFAVIDHRRYGRSAVEWATKSVDGFPEDGPLTRSRVLNLIGLTSAHFLNRDAEGGVESGRIAVAEARPLASKRVQDRLVRLRGVLLPYMGASGVRDLDDEIREAVA